MHLDANLKDLYMRGRREYELYLKDLVRDHYVDDLEEAEAWFKETHVAVPLIGDPKGGLMYDPDRPVWYA